MEVVRRSAKAASVTTTIAALPYPSLSRPTQLTCSNFLSLSLSLSLSLRMRRPQQRGGINNVWVRKARREREKKKKQESKRILLEVGVA